MEARGIKWEGKEGKILEETSAIAFGGIRESKVKT